MKTARGVQRQALVDQARILFNQLVGAKIPVEVSYRLLAARFPLRVIADATGRKWMTVQTACSARYKQPPAWAEEIFTQMVAKQLAAPTRGNWMIEQRLENAGVATVNRLNESDKRFLKELGISWEE